MFADQNLSKYQCGFRKGHSAQHLLVAMLEKWKGTFDNEKVFLALLTNLSKAFDCLPHKLITVKLNAYGFSLPALRLIHDYMSNRQQGTKINHAYSSWEMVVFGEFASDADDNTLYDAVNTTEDWAIQQVT